MLLARSSSHRMDSKINWFNFVISCFNTMSVIYRSVDTEIVEKDGFFDIFYMLTEPGTYDVDVKFGGKQVPNGLMRMTVK